ncbi:MAG: DUF1699 family protein [Methanothrix sp.]|jgi:hypothetical protein|nr:DUF1699 family protein [Methanothrix sp.]
MKIRVVNSRDQIAKLDPRERVVHLAFPLPAVVLFELMKRCPRLKAIEVPPSRFPKLSKPTLCLLEVQGVKVFPGLLWGHRTDIDEYYTVDEGAILQRAGELRAEGMDSGEIVAKVAEEAGVQRVYGRDKDGRPLYVVTPHTLRHFHAVRAPDMGITLNDLQVQLGHTDLKSSGSWMVL